MKQGNVVFALIIPCTMLINTMSYPQNCLKIAHRGASGHEPENTLLAFTKAIEFGVDIIELDVHQCASGELIVIHDATVDRTTNGTGHVQELSYEELRLLDAGNGQPIPTLNEALDLINRQAIINIELKGENTEQPVATLIDEYVQTKNWKYDNFIISSFNHHRLMAIKKILSDIQIGVLISHLPIDYAAIGQQLNAYSLHVWYESIDQVFIDDAHKRGIKLFAFTLDDPNQIEQLKTLGVDGIFSNYPEII